MLDQQAGYFVISLDTELAWGHFDLDEVRHRRFTDDGTRVRENVKRLLELFNEFGIVGTWAVVGHLLYDRCKECEICPVLAWEGKHECFTEIYKTANPLWYGADIVESILNSDVPQEIGFHGYTHRVFNEVEMTADEARIEAEEWLKAAAPWGIEAGSIVFPRNQVGHLAMFKELGFVSFRDVEIVPRKWQLLSGTRFWRGFRSLLLYTSPPATYKPALHASGLVALPSSSWMGPTTRLQRSVGREDLFAVRLKRVADAVAVAAREKTVVHVWLHPYELRADADFERLRVFLSVVGEHMARGAIRSIGMADLARAYLVDL